MDEKSDQANGRKSDDGHWALLSTGAENAPKSPWLSDFSRLVGAQFIVSPTIPLNIELHKAALRHAVFLRSPVGSDRGGVAAMSQPAAKPIIVNLDATKAFPPPPFKVKAGPLAGGRVEWIDKANDLAFVVDASGQERLVPTHRLRPKQD